MTEDRIDPQRLQDVLDDIAGTVEWAANYLDSLMESGDSPEYDCDLPGLKADLERLRVVADALVPGRVVDQATKRRWYLAGDEAAQRAQVLTHQLDLADASSERAFADSQAERDRREQDQRLSRQAKIAQDERRAENRKRVLAYLQKAEAATAKQIGKGTGVSEWEAERLAKDLGAKRSRDRRFRLPAEHQPTEPHLDSCPECARSNDGRWSLLAYAAQREEPPDPPDDGYLAYYRCDQGHNWHTWWADEMRLSPTEVTEAVDRTRALFEQGLGESA